MAAMKRVDTATLIRGSVYHFRLPITKPGEEATAIKFEYGVPVVIENKVTLAELEEIVDEAKDGEGEVYEKPVFHVERNVADPTEAARAGRSTIKRLDSGRAVRRKPGGRR